MRRPLRILQAFEPPEGGVQTHVRLVVEGLLARQHHVHVVVARDARMVSAFRDLGAGVTVADLRPEMAAGLADVRAARVLLRTLARGRFDVVHFHDTKAAALGRPLAWLTGTPAVYSPHAFAYRTQMVRGRRFAAPRRVVTLAVERALGPLTAAIVCVSEDERRAAVADRIVPPARAHLVRYGLPPAPHADPCHALDGEGPLVGFLARLHEQKGLPVLLDALEILRDEGRLPRTAIVGNGPLYDEVTGRLRRAGLSGRVTLRRFEGDVWPLLAAFDVYVLPSLWEGLPIGVLEAMAAGRPVIATAVSGTPEAVLDGITGTLVPRDDPRALADAIGALAADEQRRRAYGAAGRSRFEHDFALEGMLDRLERLYAGVVRAPSASSAPRVAVT